MNLLTKLLRFLCPLLFVIPVFGQVVNLDVSPASLQFSGSAGDTVQTTIMIANSGNSELSWILDVQSATIQGSVLNFSKDDFANINLTENQDRFSDGFIMVRGEQGGLFNIVEQSNFSNNGPIGSLWATTSTAEATSYDTWRNNAGPRRQDFFEFQNVYSMQLTEEKRFFDIQFLSWTSNDNGGGYSYTRTEIYKPLFGSEESGTVAPGESVMNTIFADLSGIPVGTYQLNLIINSNATLNSTVTIPVTIEVTDGTPVLAVSQDDIDFSNLVVGASASETVTIFNDGTSTLNVSGIASNNPVFSATPTSFSIEPSSMAEITITASPTGAGASAGTISFTSNDPSSPSIAVSVEGQNPPEINIMPASLDLSFTTGTDNQSVLTIGNTGQGELSFNLRIEPASESEVFFSKADFADETLPENQDRITPGVILTRADIRGLFNAALEDEFDRNNRTSPLGTSWSRTPTSESSNSDYGTWSSNAGPNSGNFFSFREVYSLRLEDENRFFDVQFESWTQNGDGGGFSYTRREVPGWLRVGDDPGTDGTVAASASEEITLDILPLPPGTYEANIVISSNDLDEAETVIPVTITITGGTPNLDSAPSSLEFDDLVVNNSASLFANIVNDGSANLEITNIASSSTAFAPDVTSLTVAPGAGGENIEVVFTPDAVDTFTGDLTFSTNDPLNPSFTIPMSGNGIGAPSIVLGAVPSINDLEAGDSDSFVINVQNTGASVLTGNVRIALAGAEPVFFEKMNFADPTIAENQDRITDDVFITRGDQAGLYNAALEDEFDRDTRVSPLGTEWAFGASGEVDASDYDRWNNTASPNSASQFFMFENIYSMRLIDENRYFDVQVLSWTNGDNSDGGGFSYTRTESVGWIMIQNSELDIAAGTNEDITFEINTENFTAGTFPAQIIFETNDPDNSEIVIDVQINLTGTPEVSTSSASINFGDIFIGLPEEDILTISNSGTDDLTISSVSSDDTDVVVPETSTTLGPGEEIEVTVIMDPAEAGAVTATITIESDDPNNQTLEVSVSANALVEPDIAVSPNEINLVAFSGEVVSEQINITNESGSALNWSLSPSPSPSTISLEDVLQQINNNIDELEGSIPGRFVFNYDGDGDDIRDGGNDMYDGGNRLSTDISGSPIQYSDNVIEDGAGVTGEGTRYFTRHLGGMFIFAADINGVNQFRIEGNLGADGGGNVDGSQFDFAFLGTTYTAFLKRVYNANNDPSINHLIIAENTGALSRTFSTNTNSDEHIVDGLSGITRIYYILYAGTSGLFIDDNDASNIAQLFLQTVTGSNEILSSLFGAQGFTVTPSSGTLNATESDTPTLEVDADEIGIEGTFNFDLSVFSNDPDESEIVIPVSLSLGGIVNSEPLDDLLLNEGFGTLNIDNLDDNFEDANGDALTFTGVTADASIATTTVNGTSLVITEVSTGTTIISVAASDGNGNTGFSNFQFRINAIPEGSDVEDLNEFVGFGSASISLDGIFTDDDADDVLSISAESSDNQVVTVEILDGTLVVTEQGLGTATITLTASDSFGGFATVDFTFTVNPLLSTADSFVESLVVFPNPVLNEFNIRFSAEANQEIKVSLLDISGRTISTLFEGKSNGVDQSFSMRNLKSGIYILSIERGGQLITRRLYKD